jgi:hypothetical protein
VPPLAGVPCCRPGIFQPIPQPASLPLEGGLLNHFQSIDIEKCQMFSIHSMEVWWWMVSKEKLDNNSIKSCNFRHHFTHCPVSYPYALSEHKEYYQAETA